MGSDARQAMARLEAAAVNGTLERMLEPLEVDVLGAFGSVLDDGPTPNDLDVGARFKGEPRLLELIDALTELTGYDSIDVAIITGDHPVLDANALTGIPLYEREKGQYAEAQMAALAHRRDTAWLRALDLDELAR